MSDSGSAQSEQTSQAVTVVPLQALNTTTGGGPGGRNQTSIVDALTQERLRREQRQPVRQRVGAGLNQDSSTPSVAPLVEAAISLLKQQPDGFTRIELLRQWAAAEDPKLRAMLSTEEGVEQLLTYGYQGNVLQALTVNGYSALLVEFGTAQHAATIAEQAQRANPLLAEQATIFNARPATGPTPRNAGQPYPTDPLSQTDTGGISRTGNSKSCTRGRSSGTHSGNPPVRDTDGHRGFCPTASVSSDAGDSDRKRSSCKAKSISGI